MKNLKKYRILIMIVAGLLLLALSGYLYSRSSKKAQDDNQNQSQEQQKETGQGKSAVSTEKTDNTTQNAQPVQTKPSTTTTTVTQNIGTLNDVSVTAYLYSQNSVASDGTTAMPAGSIAPVFYLESGTYTVQKMAGSIWQDVITAQSYPGHGGLSAWFSGPSEDNIQYRVLKIESGKPTLASKTFVIKRADIKNGTVTYN